MTLVPTAEVLRRVLQNLKISAGIRRHDAKFSALHYEVRSVDLAIRGNVQIQSRVSQPNNQATCLLVRGPIGVHGG